MAYLNKKEDVIDLQLTQYGKYLVSQGKFKPTYYAFFDNDIIYDQRYVAGSGLETQNKIEPRILEDTPSLSAQYLFHSVDNLDMQDQFSKTSDAKKREKVQQTPERHYVLNEPLSNSDMMDDRAPLFSVEFQNGEIKNVETVISGSVNEVFSIQRIPQINLKDVKFYITVKEHPSPGPYTDVFADNTYFHVEGDFLHFNIEEENVPLSKDNFDVEVYALDEKNKIEQQLYFRKENGPVLNDILLEDTPIPLGNENLEADSVAYFFDLAVDTAIGRIRKYGKK